MSSPPVIEFDRIRSFVTNTTRPVYCLRNLPEEVVAVLFAYYSRSRETLRENLLKLVQDEDLDLDAAAGPDDDHELLEAREKARAFHEKWVVGYGHSSVAEHAVVHVAIEDTSILAGKAVEDARLASFTEKSTRYVPFDTSRYHTPRPFQGTPAGARYNEAIGSVMSTYDDLMEPLVGYFVQNRPPRPGQSEKGHLSACRAQACDVLRYLLPAATYTNIGMTANARVLESLIVKMLSHPLDEVQNLGLAIKEEATRIVPTLLKYAEKSVYRAETAGRTREVVRELLPEGKKTRESGAGSGAPAGLDPLNGNAISRGSGGSGVRLVRYDADAETRILETILYAAAGRPFDDLAATIADLSPGARVRVLSGYLEGRGPFDPPLRALEESRYLFEIVTDYGAYRDIQRHRMAGQYPQRLSVDLQFECPPDLERAGMRSPFEQAMNVAARVHRDLAGEFPEESQYVVPLAFRTRFLMSMNLREIFHFVQLRSARQGHPSYRRVAQDVYREVARVHPGLASFIRVDLADYALSRA